MKTLINHVRKTFTPTGSKIKLVEDIAVYEVKPMTATQRLKVVVVAALVVALLLLVVNKVSNMLNKFPRSKPVSAVYYLSKDGSTIVGKT